MKKIVLTLSLFTILSSSLSTTQVAYGENLEVHSNTSIRKIPTIFLPVTFTYYPPKHYKGRTLMKVERINDNLYIGYYAYR